MFGSAEETTNLEESDPKSSGGLITEVPYVLFKVSEPNMRGIDDFYLNVMNYSNWTETKFF